jgi:L-ascorbate metabolism protein UlaG (beta-lactamase superfamily)
VARAPAAQDVPPALGPSQVGRIDALLVSHNHLDHVDRHALRLARAQGSTVVGSRAVARRATRSGVADARALVPGQRTAAAGAEIEAVPAEHPLASDAVGFLVRADGLTLYFSGDTRRSAALLASLRGVAIDVAFLQIACAVYLGRPDGMDLEEAARLAGEIRPRRCIPMHYHGRLKRADPHAFAARIRSQGLDATVIDPGREIEVG